MAFSASVGVPVRRARGVRGARGAPAPSAVLARGKGRVRVVESGVDLREAVRESGRAKKVLVVKLFSKKCRACVGVAPKFRKIADTYGDGVGFLEMDFEKDEQFARDVLGCRTVPFFGIFSGGQFVGGEAIGWERISTRLTESIDRAVEGVDALSDS